MKANKTTTNEDVVRAFWEVGKRLARERRAIQARCEAGLYNAETWQMIREHVGLKPDPKLEAVHGETHC